MKIKTYSSVIEAAEQISCQPHAITKAANARSRHCKGWQWKFGNRSKIKSIRRPHKNTTPVGQYTLRGKLLKKFLSVCEAERLTGFDDIGIRKCAKGKQDSYKGFIWKYID